jgi:hypothetical protein
VRKKTTRGKAGGIDVLRFRLVFLTLVYMEFHAAHGLTVHRSAVKLSTGTGDVTSKITSASHQATTSVRPTVFY